jgi:hypothetical protein
MSYAIVAAAVLLMLGVVLVSLGLRGRRLDDHPVCRRCRFDLSGTPGRALCPECGSKLEIPAAIRIGNRSRRSGLVAAGIACVVLLLLGGGLAFSSSRFNLAPHLPTPVLMLQARIAGSAAESLAAKELIARHTAKKLSASQIAAALNLALARQADRSRAWDPAWGDFIAAVHAAGGLSPQQLAQYVEHGVLATISVRPRAISGERAGVEAAFRTDRLAAATTVSLQVELERLALADTAVTDIGGSAQLGMTGLGGPSAWSRTIPVAAPPGIHAIDSVWKITAYEGQAAGPSPVAVWRVKASTPIELLPPGSELVRLVSEESQRSAIESAITVRPISLTADGRHTSVEISIRGIPVALACDAFLRDESGKEWKAGSLSARASTPNNAHASSTALGADLAGFASTQADLILRPSPAAAASTIHINEIWGREIIVPGIAVHRPEP